MGEKSKHIKRFVPGVRADRGATVSWGAILPSPPSIHLQLRPQTFRAPTSLVDPPPCKPARKPNGRFVFSSALLSEVCSFVQGNVWWTASSSHLFPDRAMSCLCIVWSTKASAIRLTSYYTWKPPVKVFNTAAVNAYAISFIISLSSGAAFSFMRPAIAAGIHYFSYGIPSNWSFESVQSGCIFPATVSILFFDFSLAAPSIHYLQCTLQCIRKDTRVASRTELSQQYRKSHRESTHLYSQSLGCNSKNLRGKSF